MKNTKDMIDKIPYIKIEDEVIDSLQVYKAIKLRELFVAIESELDRKGFYITIQLDEYGSYIKIKTK